MDPNLSFEKRLPGIKVSRLRFPGFVYDKFEVMNNATYLKTKQFNPNKFTTRRRNKMKKLTIHKKAIAPISSLIVLLFTVAAVYAADRLIIEDNTGTPVFTVDDAGKITADFDGSNSDGDGLTTLMDLIADNEDTSKVSDVGLKLENFKAGFRWTFRTFEPTEGFSATKLGSGGTEFLIENDTDDFTNVSLTMGNGAVCTQGGVWQDASSRDYKENIKDITTTEAMKTLANLKPVKYNLKKESSNDLNVGFIAEDVPELVATKSRKTLSALEIAAVLTKVVQQQQEMITKLNEEVKGLKDQQSDLFSSVDF
jgi:hypothetical protein